MYKKILLLPILVLAAMSFIVSCDNGLTSINDTDEIDNLPELRVMNGGENATLMVKRGDNSYFNLNLSNTGSNRHLATGSRSGWSILSESAISHDTTYDDVSLYSTYEEEYWKPVNYLLNERENLKMNDDQITYREIQAAIWALIDSGFDLEKVDANYLPNDMTNNGKVNFNKEKVNQIVNKASSNARSFKYDPESIYAVIARSATKGEFIIIEESAYVFDMVDLKTSHNMVVAWDVNDNGQIAGGNLLLDNQGGITDMGSIFARALNNQGQVVGTQGQQAAYWDAGSGVVTLSSLGGDASEANGINESGQITGEVMKEVLLYEDEEFGDEYDYEFKAFVWSNSDESQTIGEEGWATGINNNGFVVGTDYSISDRGFIWDEQNGMKSLGSFQGFSSARANAINNQNEVVGSVLVAKDGSGNLLASSSTSNDELRVTIDDIERTFKRANAGGAYHYAHVMEMIQNSTLERDAFPWKREISQKISAELYELAQMTRGKTALASSRSEAFIWDDVNGMMNLGTLGGDWSTAWDVNDHGQVVGYSDIGNGENRAFYWDEENGMIELPTFGGNSLARAINNEGQIVGYSYDSDGNFFPVLWNLSINHP